MLNDLFQQHIEFYYISSFLLGLIVGSFLNVVIYRLPIMLKRGWKSECLVFLAEEESKPQPQNSEQDTPLFNLNTPRSRCPKCGHAISAWENIPIISYLILGGRCAECKTAISLRYPAIELFSAILTLACAWHFGVSLNAAFAILLSWALVALAFIDLDEQYLPDSITQPMLWLGLLLNTQNLFTDLESAVIGAAAGYLILWSVYMLFKKLTGKEGMGFGDFKLLAMLGAWLGWQMLPAVILLSSIVGAVIGILLIASNRHQRGSPIPFGPFLAAAGWIALLWGHDLNYAYLQWITN
ncbi:Leader peptidase (Prepilin peptidase) / N-methyltransferase [hydrothermal vent metagenome]|uniref:Leader peptidase (Prepilin peptidase) / N-methyltransferase n=1 Tax=hydrothermal vent metagenome TaxID=652676 RepID=A0A3B1B0W3_9ZZZZ